jgi:hypothetical protein
MKKNCPIADGLWATLETGGTKNQPIGSALKEKKHEYWSKGTCTICKIYKGCTFFRITRQTYFTGIL